MFKDFNISSFKKLKPPSDNSFDTDQEIKELKKIPLNKSFVKKFDDIESAFVKTAKDNNIEDYDKKIAAKLIKDSAPVILELKKHFNRPRPKKLDKKLLNHEMDSMKTPSYPSGHSTQGYLLAEVLKDKYPEKSKELDKKAKDISDSRNIAKAHYKSDSRLGKQLGLEMYKYLKDGK